MARVLISADTLLRHILGPDASSSLQVVGVGLAHRLDGGPPDLAVDVEGPAVPPGPAPAIIVVTETGLPRWYSARIVPR